MVVQRSGNWRADLVAAYPTLFNQEFRGQVLTPGWPEVDDGWRELLEVAASRIAAALAADPSGSLTISQIKSKYGTLRLYYDVRGRPETEAAIAEAVDLAEARSACTCETCGAEGRLFDDGGWFVTACDAHQRGNPVPVRSGWERLLVVRKFGGEANQTTCRRYDRETDRFIDVDPTTLDLDKE